MSNMSARRLLILSPNEYVTFEWFVKSLCLDEWFNYHVHYYNDIKPYVSVSVSFTKLKQVRDILILHVYSAKYSSQQKNQMISLLRKLDRYIERKKVD